MMIRRWFLILMAAVAGMAAGAADFCGEWSGKLNVVLRLWADVKYHVPTGFGFSPKASVFYVFVFVPPVFIR